MSKIQEIPKEVSRIGYIKIAYLIETLCAKELKKTEVHSDVYFLLSHIESQDKKLAEAVDVLKRTDELLKKENIKLDFYSQMSIDKTLAKLGKEAE